MREITSAEFNGLKALIKKEPISQVSVDMHSNGLLRVVVISEPDADFDSVDALIEEIFPGKEYRGSVGEEEHADFYCIDVDGETLINLMMKKTPIWSAEDILRQGGVR